MDIKKETTWLLKEKYRGKATKNFYKDIKRLNKGEPLDYVIGFTEFLGCKIDLSKKPLIPRPETEFWVQKAIKDISSLAKKKPSIRCLDLFSGSGCIGVAVLSKTRILLCLPAGRQATVDLADSQTRCLQQAKINCTINKINKKRYKIIKSDIFKNIRGKYDYIFANPPYVAKNKQGRVGKAVLKYEPKEALFGGLDGLFYIKKFLGQAKKYLNPAGCIFMEFSPEQKNKIEKLLKKYKYKACKFHKDQFGRWRWVVAFT